MKKTTRNILLGIAGVIIAVSGMSYLSKSKDSEEDLKEVVIAEYTAKVGTIGVSFSADIKVEGKIVDVNAPSQDVISVIYVTEGDHITQGQVLGRFDTYELEQRYNSAMASMNKAIYERNKIDQGSNPDQYQIAQQSVNTAYASVQIAKRNLDSQTVKSPATGTIVSISARTGESVGSGSWITILRDNSFYGDVSLDETEIVKITKDTPVRVELDALEKTKFVASISSVGIVAHTDGSGYATYPVKISLEAPKDTTLRTGYEGTVTFVSKEKENVIIVPLASVGREGTTNFVNVKTVDESTEKREVVTGFTDGKNVEISSGLNEGEIVIYEK